MSKKKDKSVYDRAADTLKEKEARLYLVTWLDTGCDGHARDRRAAIVKTALGWTGAISIALNVDLADSDVDYAVENIHVERFHVFKESMKRIY